MMVVVVVVVVMMVVVVMTMILVSSMMMIFPFLTVDEEDNGGAERPESELSNLNEDWQSGEAIATFSSLPSSRSPQFCQLSETDQENSFGARHTWIKVQDSIERAHPRIFWWCMKCPRIFRKHNLRWAVLVSKFLCTDSNDQVAYFLRARSSS